MAARVLADGTPGQPAPDWITPGRAVAAVYAAGMFMSIMDTQIVNVALATLGRDFAATPIQVQWVVTGYLLSLAMCIPTSGWLGDRFGTKRVYVSAVTIFTIASALCAAATSLPELVVMRVLQGIGGGLMTPVGTAMLYRTYPPDRRVHVARLITRVTMVAPATAPIIGGIFVTELSWHWIFIVNVPFGTAAALFGARFLPVHPPVSSRRFDVPGCLLGSCGLAALLYGMTEGPTQGWASPAVWGTVAGGAAMLAGFAVNCLRRRSPLLRLRLLGDRLLGRCCLLVGCSTTAFFGSLVFTALYLQEGRGFSALQSGLTTFPEAIGIGLSSQLVARIYPRIGPRRLMAAGFAGLAAVNALLATLGAGSSLWLVRALMLCIGISVSYVMLPTQAAAFARISSSDQGDASAIFTTMQRSFSALGVAVLSSVLAIGTGHRLTAPVHAFHAVYLTAAAVALLGGVLTFWISDRAAAETMVRRRAGPAADTELPAAAQPRSRPASEESAEARGCWCHGRNVTVLVRNTNDTPVAGSLQARLPPSPSCPNVAAETVLPKNSRSLPGRSDGGPARKKLSVRRTRPPHRPGPQYRIRPVTSARRAPPHNPAGSWRKAW